jgi:hypothetical protein
MCFLLLISFPQRPQINTLATTQIFFKIFENLSNSGLTSSGVSYPCGKMATAVNDAAALQTLNGKHQCCHPLLKSYVSMCLTI